MKKRQIRVTAFCLVAVPVGSQLNDKAIADIANSLRTTPEELQKALITTETDATKMESLVGTFTKELEIFTTKDKDTLLDNHGKARYDVGKLAGIEMSVKEQKEKLGLKESKARDLDALLLEYSAKIKAESGTTETDAVKALKAEKEALQQAILSKDSEIVKWQGEVENVKTSTIINGELERAVKSISIDVPEDKENAQKEMLMNAFKGKHEVKIEEGKLVIYKDGKKLVDNLQNPLSVADAMKDFAPQYVPVKVATGRGAKGSDPSQNTLTEELISIKTRADFEGYLKTKGIDAQSDKAQEVYMALRKANPNLKLV